MKTTYIGCASGFAGDRFDASGPVVEHLARLNGPRYLIFEVLAERTLALAQRLRGTDPDGGYSPYLDHYIRPVLARALASNVCIVSNMGAANPLGAAARIHGIARELGIRPLRIAVVTGDDLTAIMSPAEIASYPTMEGISLGDRPVLAANAYLGARPIARALEKDPDIVLVGRTTDSALALGPLIHEFGWSERDFERLACGTICGHLLECGAQVTGAYFADPGFKDVPDLANVGFPVAEVKADGKILMTKPPGTGGLVSTATVTEQLLYEMHDPGAYIVPDVIADITSATLKQSAKDQVAVEGIRGTAGPDDLKATVCFDNGWLGEAEMSYAGPNALARAQLAADIVRERLEQAGSSAPLRCEVLGTGAVHHAGNVGRHLHNSNAADAEYRARIALLAPDQAAAQQAVDEMLSLYCCGPAGGGGYRCHVTPQLATASILVPRDRVEPFVRVEEVVA